jgi:hypothetical protein
MCVVVGTSAWNSRDTNGPEPPSVGSGDGVGVVMPRSRVVQNARASAASRFASHAM